MPTQPALTTAQDLWSQCVDHLAQEIPEQQLNTWLRPLVVAPHSQANCLVLQVGNRFKLDWIRSQYLERIRKTLSALASDPRQLS